MIAVIGSGFGLYGYLPAVVETGGERVLLPRRYQAAFEARPELQRYRHAVDFLSDEMTALDAADGVVIARRPEDQPDWIARALARDNIQRLFLEKPLAPTPAESRAVLDALRASGRRFRIGYVFKFTDWGLSVLERLHSGARDVRGIDIAWDFMAHHFRNDVSTWKRAHAAGGGALRFYGIQMIALLAEAGFTTVVSSATAGAAADPERWEATFAGGGLPECRIRVDTRASASRFFAGCTGPGSREFSGALTDPLELPRQLAEASAPGGDRRIPLLGRLVASLEQDDEAAPAWYARVIDLWERVEEANVTVLADAVVRA